VNPDPRALSKEYVKKDVEVIIERLRTKKEYSGKVIEIIDKESVNADGILVKIKGNFVGHVKKIIDHENKLTDEELLEKISRHEQLKFEMKSSFKYDLNISKATGKPTENEALKRVIAEETASFLNNNGGILCIGVDNKSKILGLENDFKLQTDYLKKNKNELIDDLRLEIKTSLGNYLKNNAIIEYVFIEPYEIDGKIILCLFISKSKEPFFVHQNISGRIDGKDKKITHETCHYRYDNGMQSVSFSDFMKIWHYP
jgi:hypothetical protein